ncbi:MAG TPA: hypothetical protein PLA94_21500, partial [Myxococcota bacterium]|nr:hypothetical protein [Myxococcota bacterium]
MAVCRCVTGIVVEEGSTLGQPGLTVEIGTRAGRGFLPVNSGRTGPDGRFSIELGAFVATAQTGTTYGLRVLAGTAELHVHGDVRWSEGVDAHGLVVCVTYPEHCSAPPPPDLDGPAGEETGLHGRVGHADGTPLDGLTVKFRTVGVAGESDDISVGTTSGGGFYSITGPGSPAPDIIVRVYTSGGRLVGTSPVIYGCPTKRRVDFEICDDL